MKTIGDYYYSERPIERRKEAYYESIAL